jgi:hypothetical protein
MDPLLSVSSATYINSAFGPSYHRLSMDATSTQPSSLNERRLDSLVLNEHKSVGFGLQI